MISLSPSAHHRWSVLSRALAVTLGAYALTSLATVALSLLLAGMGMDRVEAVTAATLASFAIFSVIAMMSFHARSAARAWTWLLAASVPTGLTVLLLMPGMKG